LYQNTDKKFVILHSLDGYDEVSLTGPFKFFYNGGEKIAYPKELGLSQLTYDDIKGGNTVEESAAVFMNVLQGKGTTAQNSAVIANAGMSLYCGHQEEGIIKAMERAKEALESGKAYEAFKKLVNS
jgi:anthranilate phosphoribosyltransferase